MVAAAHHQQAREQHQTKDGGAGQRHVSLLPAPAAKSPRARQRDWLTAHVAERGFTLALQALQIVAQGAGALVTVIALFLQRLAHDRFKIRRQSGIPLAGRDRLGGEDGIEGEQHILAQERLAAGGHLVEHGAERKDIGARVELFPARLLRRHIDGSAGNDVGGGEVFLHSDAIAAIAAGGRGRKSAGQLLASHLGQAKIQQPRRPAPR